MKQFRIFFISLTLFVLVSLMYAAYLPHAPYKADATVIEVEGTLITVETEYGNVYQFYGTGFCNGDKVIISIDTKGDKSVDNDEIVDAEK